MQFECCDLVILRLRILMWTCLPERERAAFRHSEIGFSILNVEIPGQNGVKQNVNQASTIQAGIRNGVFNASL
jgi:hypothetical protein